MIKLVLMMNILVFDYEVGNGSFRSILAIFKVLLGICLEGRRKFYNYFRRYSLYKTWWRREKCWKKTKSCDVNFLLIK